MAKKPTFSGALEQGKKLLAGQDIRPKFTEKDFLQGLDRFAQSTAEDFLEFFKTQVTRTNLSSKLDEINSLYKLDPKKELKKTDIFKCLTTEEGVLFIKNDKLVSKITMREFIGIFEAGRLDKDILPDPILRYTFDAYKGTFKKRLKKFLLGKLS